MAKVISLSTKEEILNASAYEDLCDETKSTLDKHVEKTELFLKSLVIKIEDKISVISNSYLEEDAKVLFDGFMNIILSKIISRSH